MEYPSLSPTQAGSDCPGHLVLIDQLRSANDNLQRVLILRKKEIKARDRLVAMNEKINRQQRTKVSQHSVKAIYIIDLGLKTKRLKISSGGLPVILAQTG
jgi:hypothetical protein